MFGVRALIASLTMISTYQCFCLGSCQLVSMSWLHDFFDHVVTHATTAAFGFLLRAKAETCEKTGQISVQACKIPSEEKQWCSMIINIHLTKN